MRLPAIGSQITTTCKVGEVSDVGILFATRPKKGESKEFLIKFEQTKVELVKGDKQIKVTPNVVVAEKLAGRIVQLQIENGGDRTRLPSLLTALGNPELRGVGHLP